MSAAPQIGLFDRVTAADRRKERERLQQRLEPIALQLAERRQHEGIIAADVIAEAVVRGLLSDGRKVGGTWFHDSSPGAIRSTSSKSPARKAASARIAKIPLPLARWIAHCYYPRSEAVA